jgi:hypothetical protein
MNYSNMYSSSHINTGIVRIITHSHTYLYMASINRGQAREFLMSSYSTLLCSTGDVRWHCFMEKLFNDKMIVFSIHFTSKARTQLMSSLSHWSADTSLTSLTWKNRKPQAKCFFYTDERVST